MDGADDVGRLAGQRQKLWSAQRIVSLVSLFVGAMVMESLYPILGPHTATPPENLDEAGVGVMFSIYSLAYMAASLPCGMVADKLARGPRTGLKLKSMISCGWLLMVFAFHLTLGRVGPFAAVGSLPSIRVSLIVQGIASALIIMPSLPELQYALEDGDEAVASVVC